ncbi:MAG: MBL fold metallo-hydrolase [Geobacteraceae bacterium]|nr:MBL fold metallo-hydrolase [Geobacteraceae bacterium]
MKPLFHPSLVNDPFDDPGVYIDFLFEKRAILFDLGDLHLLPPRKILRVSHVFVSHTHMDHFCGFDRMVRILLARDKRLQLFGPPGFIDRVAHRLASYTWNLVEYYPVDFTIIASEFDGVVLRSARFHCRNRFFREQEVASPTEDGVLLDDESLRVRSVTLDHRIPCLAFTLEEKIHVNIMRNRLLEQGFPVGPWLTELKKAVLRGDPDNGLFRVWWREGGTVQERFIGLGILKDEILRIVPGQKITYVTDVAYSAENVSRIRDLATGSDYLFIEAMFLQKDEGRARGKNHLTACQAGTLAREAGAVRVVPFHFSAKYTGHGEELLREVEDSFKG